jgi:RNA methyltransferase, TrmH family
MKPLPSLQSVQNSMVKHAYSLKVPKKSKDSADFLCEGFHLVLEALERGLKVRYVLATAEAWKRPEGAAVFGLAEKAKVRCFEAPAKIIAYVSDTVTPQGILAVVQKIPSRHPENPYALALAVYRVQDAGNLGTLFRSAEAFGVQCLFLTEGCCDPFNPKVVRAAMGSLFRVPFVQDGEWAAYQDWFRERGFISYALSARASRPMTETRFQRPAALWVGAEGSGLPEELEASCGERVSISMSGKVESLNVGVAASLALFWAGFQPPVS